MGEFADGRGGRAKDAALSVICVSLEEELLAKSDVLARKLGYLARLLIEGGLKAVLEAEGRL